MIIKLKDLLSESFKTGDGWVVYEGTNHIRIVFKDGDKLSFEIEFGGIYNDGKEKHRKQAASKWCSVAREIHKDVELNKVGVPLEKPWKLCFKEALEDDRVKLFIKRLDRTPVF